MKLDFCLFVAASCFLSVVTAGKLIDAKLPGSSETNVLIENVAYDPLCQNCDVLLIGGISGTFTSPNYPNLYCNGIDCYYSIKAQKGLRIQLTFTDFSTERNLDVVKIYDGSSASDPLLLEASGKYPLLTLNSTLNEMLLIFTTDTSLTSNGWSATYETF